MVRKGRSILLRALLVPLCTPSAAETTSTAERKIAVGSISDLQQEMAMGNSHKMGGKA